MPTPHPRVPRVAELQAEERKLGLASAERSAGTDKLLSAARKALKGDLGAIISPAAAAATGAGAPAAGAGGGGGGGSGKAAGGTPVKKKHKRKVR